MKKILILIALVTAVYGYSQRSDVAVSGVARTTNSSEQLLEDAFKNQRSNVQVEGQGTVIRILADDLDGDRHQRFIIRLSS